MWNAVIKMEPHRIVEDKESEVFLPVKFRGSREGKSLWQGAAIPGSFQKTTLVSNNFAILDPVRNSQLPIPPDPPNL